MLSDYHLTKIPEVPVTYLVDPEIQQGVITCIAGQPESGKSTLGTMFGMRIAQENSKMKILHLDADNPQTCVNERLSRLGTLPQNYFFWGHWVPMEHAIHSPELDAMVHDAQDAGGCVVVIDGMMGFFDVKENDNSDVAAWFKPLRKWTGYGATVIVLVHPDKE